MPRCPRGHADRSLNPLQTYMNIILNGESREFDDIVTVRDLLNRLQLEGRLAVEVNEQIVPQSEFSTHQLSSGDRIEIVRAIGGG